jgi:hypothetical protein
LQFIEPGGHGRARRLGDAAHAAAADALADDAIVVGNSCRQMCHKLWPARRVRTSMELTAMDALLRSPLRLESIALTRLVQLVHCWGASSLNGVRTMKAFFFVSAALLGIAGINTNADAQNYPWCAYYKNGGTNCGFTTFDQCMTTVSGIRGYCARNTQYVPPPGPASHPRRW